MDRRRRARRSTCTSATCTGSRTSRAARSSSRRPARRTSSRCTTSSTRYQSAPRCGDCAPARSTPGSASSAPSSSRAAAGSARPGSRPTPGCAERVDGLDDPAARRLVGAVLVADRDRRGALDPRPGRDVRHDAADPLRGRRTGRRGLPAAADHQQRRQERRLGHLHAAARRDRRRPQRPHRGPARGRPRFQVGANSPLDFDWLAATAAGDVHMRDITGGTCCVGVWGPLARDLVAAAVPRRPLPRRPSGTSARCTPTSTRSR